MASAKLDRLTKKAEARLTGRASFVFLVLAYGPVRGFFCLEASVPPQVLLEDEALRGLVSVPTEPS